MVNGRILTLTGLVAVALMAAGSVDAGDWFNWTFGGKGVKGSGDLVTEDREVREFTRIESSGSFDLYVKTGKKQEIRITFDDNLIDLIEMEVEGKTLRIFSEESYRSRHTCKIEITVAMLEGVTTRGSGDITVENVKSDRFDCSTRGSGDIVVSGMVSKRIRCDINGSGDISVGDVEGDILECRISGSGDFTAEGNVQEVEISVRGSGDVDTRDLVAAEAIVTIKGSGDARVYAQESFDGAVYGSGDISFYGDPEHTSKHVAGSGSIRRR